MSIKNEKDEKLFKVVKAIGLLYEKKRLTDIPFPFDLRGIMNYLIKEGLVDEEDVKHIKENYWSLSSIWRSYVKLFGLYLFKSILVLGPSSAYTLLPVKLACLEMLADFEALEKYRIFPFISLYEIRQFTVEALKIMSRHLEEKGFIEPYMSEFLVFLAKSLGKRVYKKFADILEKRGLKEAVEYLREKYEDIFEFVKKHYNKSFPDAYFAKLVDKMEIEHVVGEEGK